MLSVKEINLPEAQNEGLKKQNADLQETLNKIKSKLNEFADKFDNVANLEEELVVRGEDEFGEHFGTEITIWGDNLEELKVLCRDFVEFVEGVE